MLCHGDWRSLRVGERKRERDLQTRTNTVSLLFSAVRFFFRDPAASVMPPSLPISPRLAVASPLPPSAAVARLREFKAFLNAAKGASRGRRPSRLEAELAELLEPALLEQVPYRASAINSRQVTNLATGRLRRWCGVSHYFGGSLGGGGGVTLGQRNCRGRGPAQ